MNAGVTLDASALEARWGRAPGVTFAEMYGGTVALLQASGHRAVVALQGAQVLSWQKAGDAADVLWLSPVAQLGTPKAVRGGIPVCWPWFGPHPNDPAKPAHGFARARPWRVTGSAASAKHARLILGFDCANGGGDLWPHRTKAEIEVTVGETLTVALSTDNLGPAPFDLTQALHTYLRVGDIASVSVDGLDGRTYIDQLHAGARRKQDGPIIVTGETDRIYLDTPDIVIVRDETLAREISVAKSGSRSTVAWNPWIDKAKRLGDVGDEGYKNFLCIESANAGDDVVTLAPRARHRIATEISVRSL